MKKGIASIKNGRKWNEIVFEEPIIMAVPSVMYILTPRLFYFTLFHY
jgi:hypothetical protein